MLRPGRAPHSLGMRPGDQWVVITQEEVAAGRHRPEKSVAERGAGSPPPTWGTRQVRPGEGDREGEGSASGSGLRCTPALS